MVLTKRYLLLVAVMLLGIIPGSVVGQTASVDSIHASTKLESESTHLHSGSDVIFRMKLDHPLPKGAHLDVRLSPVSIRQEFPSLSTEAANPERTEFIVKAKLPEDAVTGPWHIGVVWLFLEGSSTTYNQIATNDLQFVVDGKKVDLPTRGTVSLEPDHIPGTGR